MINKPLVVVIILTCNQKKDTLLCLDSFAKVTYHNYEIILVDNGSSDHTGEYISLHYPDVHLISNAENCGAAYGRNQGIEYALSEFDFKYILFLDNDTTVTECFLQPLVEVVENHSKVGLVSPKIYQMDNPVIIDDVGGCYINFYKGSTVRRGHGELDQGQYDNNPTPNSVPAGIVLVRKKIIDQCKGFDTVFDPYGYEDLDFTLRAMKEGFAYRFEPKSVIYHKGNKTGFKGYSAEYAAIKGRNLRIFLSRHATPVQRFIFNIMLPFFGVRTLVREVMKGNAMAAYRLILSFLRKN